MNWHIIGRVSDDIGCCVEWQWRDGSGVLPNDQDLLAIKATMIADFYEVFGRNHRRCTVVFLPPMGSVSKLVPWGEHVASENNGRMAIHVEEEK